MLATSLAPVLALLALAPGDVAPDFTARNQDGKAVSLSSFRGKPVLLFFYPKDDTPGCTKEACNLRDVYKQFQAHGAVVLGVSRQDEKRHQAFRAKYHLPFDLLADPEGKVAAVFGIEQYPVVGLLKRQSVLVAPDGKVFRCYVDVDPEKHAAEVLKDLDQLAGSHRPG